MAKTKTRILVAPTTKSGYVVVEVVDSADGDACLVVNNSRVAGAEPSLRPNNIRYRWNVRSEYLAAATKQSSDVEKENARVQGIAMCLSTIWTIGHHGAVVVEAAAAASLTLDKMKSAGVPQQDLINLRRAGVR